MCKSEQVTSRPPKTWSKIIWSRWGIKKTAFVHVSRHQSRQRTLGICIQSGWMKDEVFLAAVLTRGLGFQTAAAI